MIPGSEAHNGDWTQDEVLVMIALEVLRGLKNGDPSLPQKAPKQPDPNKTPRCNRVYTQNVFFAFRQHFQHAINKHIGLLTPYYPELSRHARAVSGLVSPVWHAVKTDPTVQSLVKTATDRDREEKLRRHKLGLEMHGAAPTAGSVSSEATRSEGKRG
ncbi:hypothetical protein AURDEDRAFT_131744 [Auricularia subglabra TFB-10046 SS5]|uniref:Uncharacterized protein n=1 Tax=Auricularia subglabra (strain TFB-10046 / SS5) TaxID=717982 RepID=J0WLX3_AURST|nr:hypothetical protein AURDEDRAFT_131744 [Auricularia subglabra TFB-10046 SS5]